MDRVRLGRALGYGARHAAKTLAQAVDAATAPNPSSPAKPASPTAAQPPSGSDLRANLAQAQRGAAQAQQAVAQAQRTVHQTQSRLGGAARQAGKSALAPVARFSSVLWLEVTGTFFALLAFGMGEGVWRLRAALKLASNSPDRMKLYGCAALMVLFTYFTISNFVRASRRQRR